MKKAILIILGVIMVVGMLAGAGFAGYRIGYKQGIGISANSAQQLQPPSRLAPFGQDRIPFRDFRQLDRGFGPGRFSFGPRMGFGFFGLFSLAGRVIIWGVILWFIVWLVTKSGWQLTRTSQPVNTSREEPDATKSAKTDE